MSEELLKSESVWSQCRFIGEESVDERGVELTDHPTWLIDPIDGTSNFVHRSVSDQQWRTNS